VTRATLLAILSRFLITRIVLFAIAIGAVSRLPVDPVEARGFHLPPQSHAFLEAWARYDACWYVTIAERGYRDPLGGNEDMRAAFFPLFPSLVAGVTRVVQPPLLAGLVIANACYLVFLLVLWALFARDWGERVADAAVWIYLLFPSAFFLSAPYSESVLLAVSAGAVLLARQRRWLGAGLLAALSTLARPLGVVAIVPVLAEYIAWRRGAAEAPARLGAIVAPVAAAALVYVVLAWNVFGSALAVIDMQASVRGSVGPPWQPFVEMWQTGPRLHGFNNSLVDAGLALAAIVSLPVLFATVPLGYACYALVVVLVPASQSLISFNRLLLPSFPHAALLARALEHRWMSAALYAAFALGQAVGMTAFATWHWVA
jgi:Gpi18-like mannosyltransferase